MPTRLWSFPFNLPNPPIGESIDIVLVFEEQAASIPPDAPEYLAAQFELLRVLALCGRPANAAVVLERMVEHGCTAKRKVACGMLVGTAAERSHDYEQAAERYAWVLAQDPEDNEKRYFAHNNLAYSLNQLGRHREAEPHARSAIALDPELFNAHKNLGVAVEGQGRYLEAGYEYLESAYIYPLDFRARDHLIALVGKQPELREQIEGLDDEIEFLRRDLVKALEARDEKLDKLRLARGDMANARMSCEKSLGTRQQPTHPDTTNPE